LLTSIIELERLDERIAEPHIGQKPFLEAHEQSHVIKFRSGLATVADTRRKHLHLEAQLAQKPRKQAV
jgi:hypothetical protein